MSLLRHGDRRSVVGERGRRPLRGSTPQGPWRGRGRRLIYYAAAVAAAAAYAWLLLRLEPPRDYRVRGVGPWTIEVATPGYNGMIVFTVRMEPLEGFRDFRLIASNETPLYASPEKIRAYFRRLEGSRPDRVARVEGITGATVTTLAIRRPLEGLRLDAGLRWEDLVPIAVLWALAAAAALLRRSWLLAGASILAFATLGVLNASLSVYALAGPFRVLTILAVGTALVYGNLYCDRVCPFGSLQRLALRAGVRPRLRLPPEARAGRWVLLALAVVSLALGVRLHLEPYEALFSRQPRWTFYLLPAGLLAAALFVPRLWCRGFCPLGAALEICGRIRRRALAQPAGGAQRRVPAAPSPRGLWMAAAVFGLIFVSNLLVHLGL